MFRSSSSSRRIPHVIISPYINKKKEEEKNLFLLSLSCVIYDVRLSPMPRMTGRVLHARIPADQFINVKAESFGVSRRLSSSSSHLLSSLLHPPYHHRLALSIDTHPARALTLAGIGSKRSNRGKTCGKKSRPGPRALSLVSSYQGRRLFFLSFQFMQRYGSRKRLP